MNLTVKHEENFETTLASALGSREAGTVGQFEIGMLLGLFAYNLGNIQLSFSIQLKTVHFLQSKLVIKFVLKYNGLDFSKLIEALARLQNAYASITDDFL